jgi:hypothetical protein
MWTPANLPWHPWPSYFIRAFGGIFVYLIAQRRCPERVRNTLPRGEIARTSRTMRPIDELADPEETQRTIQRLTLEHFDAAFEIR